MTLRVGVLRETTPSNMAASDLNTIPNNCLWEKLRLRGGGLYWNQPVGRSDGRSVGRAVGLSAKSCPDNSSYSLSPIRLMLDTWQKCSLGAADVNDTHFVKIPSIITELFPLI